MTNDMWLPSLWGRSKNEDHPFHHLQKRMDDLLGEFGAGVGSPLQSGGSLLTPRIDVSETDNAIEITAELPGVDEKDLDVSLVGRQLTIKGEKKSDTEEKDEERHFHRIERTYGAFQRTMTLPFDVDSSDVSADFKKGVLKVRLPKPAEVQSQTRKIDVKSD